MREIYRKSKKKQEEEEDKKRKWENRGREKMNKEMKKKEKVISIL